MSNQGPPTSTWVLNVSPSLPLASQNVAVAV